MNSSPSVSISIFSHGHRQHLILLLRYITQSIDVTYEIFLTMNFAEDNNFLEEFKNSPIYILTNPDPKGFGANHNSAFSRSRAAYFAILNPDIRAYRFQIQPLLDNFLTGNIAATVPLILNNNGIVQESIRKFPTPLSLLARK